MITRLSAQGIEVDRRHGLDFRKAVEDRLETRELTEIEADVTHDLRLLDPGAGSLFFYIKDGKVRAVHLWMLDGRPPEGWWLPCDAGSAEGATREARLQ